jgi:hypothetical protein
LSIRFEVKYSYKKSGSSSKSSSSTTITNIQSNVIKEFLSKAPLTQGVQAGILAELTKKHPDCEVTIQNIEPKT